MLVIVADDQIVRQENGRSMGEKVGLECKRTTKRWSSILINGIIEPLNEQASSIIAFPFLCIAEVHPQVHNSPVKVGVSVC